MLDKEIKQHFGEIVPLNLKEINDSIECKKEKRVLKAPVGNG